MRSAAAAAPSAKVYFASASPPSLLAGVVATNSGTPGVGTDGPNLRESDEVPFKTTPSDTPPGYWLLPHMPLGPDVAARPSAGKRNEVEAHIAGVATSLAATQRLALSL